MPLVLCTVVKGHVGYLLTQLVASSIFF